MQKIIIYLQGTDLSQPTWAIVNENGILQKMQSHGELSNLVIDAVDKEIIAIAPPESVLLVEASLPKLNKQRLLQALPYALEEQLLTPVDELHFAVGDYQDDSNMYPVAIIDKAKIKYIVDTLKLAGLNPSYLLPAQLALPTTNANWYVQLVNDIAIVRTGQYTGFACDIENLPTALSLKTDQKDVPKEIYLINLESAPFLAEKSGLLDLVTEKRMSEKQFFAEIFSEIQEPPINLLQGEFRAQRKVSENKKIWAWAAYVTAALLILVLFSNLVSFFILHHQNAQLETAINTIYKHHFPNASSVVAPKKRMQEKIASLTNQYNNNQLFILLAHLGNSLLQENAISPQQLDYRNKQLRLEFKAPDFSSVDTLSKALTQQGINVKQQNVTSVGNQIKGTLIISKGNDA